MARRYSSSQLKSKLRQTQAKQRQAINNYNQAVRKHNAAAKQRNQKIRRLFDNYNRAVWTYNNRLRANKQRLTSELTHLSNSSSSSTSRYVVSYQQSSVLLSRSYQQLDSFSEAHPQNTRLNWIADLSERETANSIETANVLTGITDPSGTEPSSVLDKDLLDSLSRVSVDLSKRWTGAVFALNPQNPDAARHFCTSAREIIHEIIESQAPDEAVFSQFPNCDTTDRGTPTRRMKIKFCLDKQGLDIESLESFVEEDVDNIVQLFRVFNDGTHGSAGTFNLAKLGVIKKRVEEGIVFLTEIVGIA